MRTSLKLNIFWLVVVLSSPVATGHSSETLSDDQKKEIVYALYADYKKDFPGVRDLSPAQARALLQKGEVVFVDTRKPAEMSVSMLPQAIPQSVFLENPDKYRRKTVVAYCTVSYRSGVFAREMAAKGFTVYNLRGGILAWTLEGGKVFDAEGRETHRVHVYGKKWNFAPAGYETVEFSLWEQMF